MSASPLGNRSLVALPWEERLEAVMATMREISTQTDPQEMVRRYAARMETLMPVDRRISLSRRGLEWPQLRVTRFNGWKEDINPWKQPDRLPVLKGGILSELIYGERPRYIPDFQLDPNDPARPYLEGQRSVVAVPMLDQGKSLNMVVIAREQPEAFDPEALPEQVWLANLFGRATHNLVLADQLKSAYDDVDRELKAVADIQRSLLPGRLPEIPTLKLAADYRTARRAGGDYYDFFELPDGRWGLLVADVSGHGTPAAVMMAVMHSIAHNYPGPPNPPSRLLDYLNRKLCTYYTGDKGTFVTAFYAIYDAAARTLTYSSAGHNPPRVRHCGYRDVATLDGAQRFPLGVFDDADFVDTTHQLKPGDQLVLYTDGIVEAASPSGELFGPQRLDELLGNCSSDPAQVVASVLFHLDRHTEGAPASDDRTIVVARVT